MWCACAGGTDPRPRSTTGSPSPGTTQTTATPPAIDWRFERELLLDETAGEQVCNLRRVDLGTAPTVELLVAVASPETLYRVSCEADCRITSLPIEPGVVPARTATADLDGDGDRDIVLTDIGVLGPTNDPVGAVWIGWADPAGWTFEPIATGLYRTVCAEPADLDGDGDLDLTLCQFGHEVGELSWIEQGPAGWTVHPIDLRPGAIHAFAGDLDGDGDLDLVAPIAQDSEEVMAYWNDGQGRFTPESLFQGPATWFGLSGVELVDLDQDGDLDVLFTNGDTMDFDLPYGVDPNEEHGVHWLRNDGVVGFRYAPIHAVWGAYAVRAADLDADGDLDLVLGSFLNTRGFEDFAMPTEVTLLVNDGQQRFEAVPLTGAAPQIASLELADADGDGDLDIFTGSMFVDPAQQDELLVLLRNRTGEALR